MGGLCAALGHLPSQNAPKRPSGVDNRSYVKARAEGAGLSADGGLVERAERLILALVGTGLEGLGVPYALAVALWVLAAASVWTFGQRMVTVRGSGQGTPAGQA